jgi:hypothetical protein
VHLSNAQAAQADAGELREAPKFRECGRQRMSTIDLYVAVRSDQ